MAINNDISKIYISGDHRGVGLKLYLVQMLRSMGYEVHDLGVDNPEVMADFPVVTQWTTDAMLKDKLSRGVVVCGHGGGVEIAANRFRHIRATRVSNPAQAREDRIHDDTNVIAFGADDIDMEMALLSVQAFLETPFDAAFRRVRRIKQIS
ncbi:MAG: RpiB/LacA/LacB family sugar-phosphate isomerase [Rickettsiales bacterium]|jgi:ribose 5-phosphate isomerase B|nr:RpiB/LacA/LacB family sugar-phosphate isomerase [Rickettsiales bacterium]